MLTADSHPGFDLAHICQLCSHSLLSSKTELSSPHRLTNTLPLSISLWNSNWHSPKCPAAVTEHAPDHLALNWAPLHHSSAITLNQLSIGNVTPVAAISIWNTSASELKRMPPFFSFFFFWMTLKSAQHKGNVSCNALAAIKPRDGGPVSPSRCSPGI